MIARLRSTAARLLYELSRMDPPSGTDRRSFESAVEGVKEAVGRLLARVPGEQELSKAGPKD